MVYAVSTTFKADAMTAIRQDLSNVSNTVDRDRLEKMLERLTDKMKVEFDLVAAAGPYTHAPTTWKAAAFAAIQWDINAINNTADRKVIKDMMVAFISALSDEFEVVDQT